MEKILFYIRTENFGVESFNGFSTLKDFYHATLLSLKLSSKLHTLKPLKTTLLIDENGKDILLKNSDLKFDEIKLVEDLHTPLDLYCNEFPALHVKSTVFPFMDIPVNLYNSKFLCFNIHTGNKVHTELAENVIKIFRENGVDNLVLKKIKRQLKTGKINSINNAVLGSNDIDLFRNFSIEVNNLYQKIGKYISNKLFFEFVESVYLYYYLRINGINITTVNPYIPEEDYFNFKYFLTERLCLYILGDKTNELSLRAIEQLFKETNSTF